MSRIIKRTRKSRVIRRTIKLDLDYNEIVFLKWLAILYDKEAKPIKPGLVTGVSTKIATQKLLAIGLLDSDDGGRPVSVPQSTLKEVNRWRVSSGER